MSSSSSTLTQLARPDLPGTWRLDAARAITLRPKEDGVLRIAYGEVWITFDGPHGGHGNESGDFLLGAGQQLRVRAGRRLVMESSVRGQPAFFSWDFVPQAKPVRSLEAVLQPWHDLRLALALAARSAWRLAKALVRVGVGLVLPRPKGAAA